jgi:hypothetical protein
MKLRMMEDGIKYSSRAETKRIFDHLCASSFTFPLPPDVVLTSRQVHITANRDFPYFPIPFKETETTAALKAVEGCLASVLSTLRYGFASPPRVIVSLEKTTAFLFQAYLATVGGFGKLDPEVKPLLKGTWNISIVEHN